MPWTVTNDFENGTLGQQTVNGRLDCTYSDDYAKPGGTKSGRMFIANGSNGDKWGGGLSFASNVTNGMEFWHRMFWYFPPSFSFACDPVFKMIRLSYSSDGYMGINGTSSGKLRIANEPVGSPWFQANVEPHNGQQPPISGISGRNSNAQLVKGSWNALELYIKLSHIDGQGEEIVWLNGQRVFWNDQIKTAPTASHYIKGTLFGTYWNGGATQSQSCYIDDLVWTTQTPGDTDALGHPFIGLSGFTPGSPETNEAATGKPAITGTAQQGQLLTADYGTTADADGIVDIGDTAAWQWRRNRTEIGGATATAFTPTADEVGAKLRVKATVTDSEGDTYPAIYSPDTGTIQAP